MFVLWGEEEGYGGEERGGGTVEKHQGGEGRREAKEEHRKGRKKIGGQSVCFEGKCVKSPFMNDFEGDGLDETNWTPAA